jgi:glucosamine-6-phosphate deaminase
VQVVTPDNREKAALLVARFIAREIKGKPQVVLGLATGRTMEAVYRNLVEIHQKEKLDFSQCQTFNLDEYVGLPPENEHSYHFYMTKHLFSKVNIDLCHVHLLNGMAKDLKAECQSYEKLIQECGGIDLQLLGIGLNGHIGFNEPYSSLSSRTRKAALASPTIAQNKSQFGNDEEMIPKWALTMGIGTILEARCCILLATGIEKAEILAKMVDGPVKAALPASALQVHPNCIVIADEAAASQLQSKDDFKWIFENDPEWEEFRIK